MVEPVHVWSGPKRISRNSCEHLAWLEMTTASEPTEGEEEENLTWAQPFLSGGLKKIFLEPGPQILTSWGYEQSLFAAS